MLLRVREVRFGGRSPNTDESTGSSNSVIVLGIKLADEGDVGRQELSQMRFETIALLFPQVQRGDRRGKTLEHFLDSLLHNGRECGQVRKEMEIAPAQVESVWSIEGAVLYAT